MLHDVRPEPLTPWKVPLPPLPEPYVARVRNPAACPRISFSFSFGQIAPGGRDDEPSARAPATRCTDGETKTSQDKSSQDKTSQDKSSLFGRTPRYNCIHIPHMHHQCAACLRTDEPSRRPRAPGKRAAALVGTPLSTSDSSVYTRFKACFKAQVMPRARGTAQPSKKLPKISQSDAEGTRDGHHAVDNS